MEYDKSYEQQCFKIEDESPDKDGFELYNVSVPMLPDDYIFISDQISNIEINISNMNEQRKKISAVIHNEKMKEMDLIHQLTSNSIRKDLYCTWIFNFDSGKKKIQCKKTDDSIIDVSETDITPEERQMHLFNNV